MAPTGYRPVGSVSRPPAERSQVILVPVASHGQYDTRAHLYPRMWFGASNARWATLQTHSLACPQLQPQIPLPPHTFKQKEKIEDEPSLLRFLSLMLQAYAYSSRYGQFQGLYFLEIWCVLALCDCLSIFPSLHNPSGPPSSSSI
jgi:hypothetical protein